MFLITLNLFKSCYQIIRLIDAELSGFAKIRETFLVFAYIDIRQSSIEIGFRKIAVEEDSPRVELNRIFPFPLCAEDVRFVIERKREIRLQPKHLIVVALHDIKIHVRGSVLFAGSASVFEEPVTPVSAAESEKHLHFVVRSCQLDSPRAIIDSTGVVLHNSELDSAGKEDRS